MMLLPFASLVHKHSGLMRLLPQNLAVKVFSSGRLRFMQQYYKSTVKTVFKADNKWKRTLWGFNFPVPLMNSAGMFKYGEGYDVVYAQGAGGYIGGTSTFNPREGNTIQDVKLPFITLPESNVSINSLGLPNLGDDELSKKSITYNKFIPLGWSLMRSPDYEEQQGLENLVKSLWKYHDNHQIDFLEINESCPNIKVSAGNINARLEYIANNFLRMRKRHLPVVIKLSNDTTINVLKNILDTLFKFGYDGINLGNTSTDYPQARLRIAKPELKLFDSYTANFAGGMGGNILKHKSFNLCEAAVKYRNEVNPGYEFHIIRSGGIECLADIMDSDTIGVSLNQWYTGYFTNYINLGNQVYKEFFNGH